CAGVFCGLLTRSIFLAWLTYGLLLVLSLVATLFPIYVGPQVFAYNLFAGYFPGPLYDEALSIPTALLWFRLETVLFGFALLGLSALLINLRSGSLGLPSLRPAALLLFLVSALGVAALERKAGRLGMRMTEAALKDDLGGVRETPRVRVH